MMSGSITEENPGLVDKINALAVLSVRWRLSADCRPTDVAVNAQKMTDLLALSRQLSGKIWRRWVV